MPDVREKLVELQRSALEYLSDACSGHGCDECPYNEHGRNCDFVVRAEYLIANGVTIPIRCKECKNRDEITGECKHPKAVGWDVLIPDDNDFCSYGERIE